MKKITQILITFCLVGVLFSCEKEEKAPIGGNKITIGAITVEELANTSATVSSSIEIERGTKVIEHGHCWSTTPNPVVEGSKTTHASIYDDPQLDFYFHPKYSSTVITSQLKNILPKTTYYIRSYVTTEYETIYGVETNIDSSQRTVTDVDGNIYNTIIIGSKVWMAENLKTTKYNDGTAIPNITDDTSWEGLTTGAYCWYNNDFTNKSIYGALYNWYTVNTGKLAPVGWHVPTDEEWTILSNHLGDMYEAGGKLKEAGTTHWKNPNAGATNTTGFTGLPGGNRLYNFNYIGLNGEWWSSTEVNNSSAFSRVLHSDYRWLSDYNFYRKDYGVSVRCVKDY